ncbi:MAG: hypothetical protein HPY76_10030 [Anaerolineae bacterium]|nr:hypothetical protein [Anaerolineae bacterium]
MKTWELDLMFLQAAVPDLQRYLLSKEIYYPITYPRILDTAMKPPRLTIGGIRLSQERLSVIKLEYRRAIKFRELNQQISEIYEKWKSNWGRKSAQEISNRQTLWHNCLRELMEHPSSAGSQYSQSVRWRVIIELIKDYGKDYVDGFPASLAALDRLLVSITSPGPFVWEEIYKEAFPYDAFWFLYRNQQ